MTDENKPIIWNGGPERLAVERLLSSRHVSWSMDRVATLGDVRAALEPMGLRVVSDDDIAHELSEQVQRGKLSIAKLEKELANCRAALRNAAEALDLAMAGCADQGDLSNAHGKIMAALRKEAGDE